MTNHGRYSKKDDYVYEAGRPTSAEVAQKYASVAREYRIRFPYKNDFGSLRQAEKYLTDNQFIVNGGLARKSGVKAWIAKYRAMTGTGVWVSYF